MQLRARSYLANYSSLALFAVLVVFAMTTLGGWWTGSVGLVQPRPYDAVLPANAALCLMLIGLAGISPTFMFRRTGIVLSAIAAALAGSTFLEATFNLNFGIDNILTEHQKVVAGERIGRARAGLSLVLLVAAAFTGWRSAVPDAQFRSPALAFVGSLMAAYGLTAALAGKTGLNAIATWRVHGQLGPGTAIAIIALGTALILLATRESTDRGAPMRWLWLPVIVSGFTLTFFFWFALREREFEYINNTTQLTINNFATLYNAECLSEIENLRRMADRWTQLGGTPQQMWERDAAAQFKDFEAFRALLWVDSSQRTRWLYPRIGNEDYIGLDHASDPVRWRAIERARREQNFALAGPIESPLWPPFFSVYTPVQRNGQFDGFIVGDIFYDQLIRIIDQRINLSSLYGVSVTMPGYSESAASATEVGLYESGLEVLNDAGRLRQRATFNLFGQTIHISLAPRPDTRSLNRQFLPEITLFSGIGLTLLLGLIVNLAQTAHARRRSAEMTSAQLRVENEERRRVEARLKVTDERLNLALSSTMVGVFEWDVPTGHMFYSPSVWMSVGYDAASMPATAQTWLDLMHPEDVDNYKAAVESHFKGETALIEHEYRIRHANGEWAWMSARAKCVSFDPQGRPQRVTGTCQNVTDRKKAEEALRTSQAATRMLSHVASRTENPVVITSAGGNIEWTNESFSRLTGYKLEDVRGALLFDLLSSPDDDPRALDRVTQALVRGESITTDVSASSRELDRRYHLKLELQPVRNDAGQIENFIAIAADITSRVETENELRRAKSEADAASRAKSEFLASMSHEIRTPMNGVIGMTSLLLETQLTPEQRDYVNTVRTSGDALLAVINEILDFSKIESGKMELESQPFELSQCIEEALDIFALQAATKNIELAYFIDAAVPPWIEGDMTRLRQVLVNLVNNAVKFTPQGLITVEVHIATVETKPGMFEPHAEADKLLLDFFVNDTGIGIPPERRHLLFKPFSQVDSSTTRKFGGTGLGLAICDRLCRLMGGTIDIKSSTSEGSTFRFSILAKAVPPVVEDDLPPIAEKYHGAYVLIVDDLEINRAMLSRTISTMGFTPLATHNLFNAAELVVKNRVVAAIIDDGLEYEPGLPMAEQLRKERPKLPIILFISPIETAKRSESADPSFIRLPKPIKPSVVKTMLTQFFSSSSDYVSQTNPPMQTESDAPSLASSIPLDILLVEDNPVNQKVALRFLNRLGYRADAVGNGLEAVRALEQRKYDLVFMDVQMPEMDGFTATKEIRNSKVSEFQPRIVALTANAIQGDRERCLAAGMDDYISKPVKIESLEQVIQRFFAQKKKS